MSEPLVSGYEEDFYGTHRISISDHSEVSKWSTSSPESDAEERQSTLRDDRDLSMENRVAGHACNSSEHERCSYVCDWQGMAREVGGLGIFMPDEGVASHTEYAILESEDMPLHEGDIFIEAEALHSSGDNSSELKSEFNHNETTKQRLERWRGFYSKRPRDCYLDRTKDSAQEDTEEFLGRLFRDCILEKSNQNGDDTEDDAEAEAKEFRNDELFDELFEEVKRPVGNTFGQTLAMKYRSEDVVRSFWDDFRRQLKDDDSPVLEWPPIQEQADEIGDEIKSHFDEKRRSQMQPERPESPEARRTADGRDPELLELREHLLKRSPEQLRRLREEAQGITKWTGLGISIDGMVRDDEVQRAELYETIDRRVSY